MTLPDDPPNYSRPPLDTLLDALDKGYVGVRVEQGVPVLDRDLNLLGDLVAATLRGVVARYIGDGVAAGSDAFLIAAVDADNDFKISAGAEPPGRCLVGGVEAAIRTTVRYRDQGGDANGEGPDELTTPDADDPDPRTDTVYLDVWLAEEAGAVDDELLNFHDVGMRTSTRTRVAWRVRVAEGGDPPAPERGHLHYPLARLDRPRDDDRIRAGHITDLRRTHLNLAEVEERVGVLERLPERLLEDLFDVSPPEYESGEGRPVISARAALNALLHGKLPGTPEQRPDDVDAEDLHWHAALRGDGSVFVAWVRRPHEAQNQRMIMAQRVQPDGAHEPPLEITPPVDWGVGTGVTNPRVAPLAQDRVLLAHTRLGGAGSGEARIRFKLGSFDDLGEADEHSVGALDFMQLGPLHVVVTGSLATFLVTNGHHMVYVRLRWTQDPDEWWVDEEPQTLGAAPQGSESSAVAAPDGRIWVAYRVGESWQDRDLRVQRLDPESGSVDRDMTRTGAQDPALHCTTDGVPWLFWHDEDGQHHCASFDGDDWQDEGHLPITEVGISRLSAVDSRDGALWLFMTRPLPEDGLDVGATRRDPGTGFWSPILPVGPAVGHSAIPFAVSDGGPEATLFYGHAETPNQFAIRMFRKRIVTVF